MCSTGVARPTSTAPSATAERGVELETEVEIVGED
jgi:hypothetical protein